MFSCSKAFGEGISITVDPERDRARGDGERGVGNGSGRRRSSDGECGALNKSPKLQVAHRHALPSWAGAKLSVAYLATKIIQYNTPHHP